MRLFGHFSIQNKFQQIGHFNNLKLHSQKGISPVDIDPFMCFWHFALVRPHFYIQTITDYLVWTTSINTMNDNIMNLKIEYREGNLVSCFT